MDGKEVAYFSNSKLYVTHVESMDKISVGTEENGFLDIFTTELGVAFAWRTR